MSASQKFKDLILLLKRDRKAQVIAGIVVLLLAWTMFIDDTANQRRAQINDPGPRGSQGTGAMSGEEAYNDLVTRFNNDLETIKKQSLENAEQLQEQRQLAAQQEERTAEIFKLVLERISEIESSVKAQAALGATPTTINSGDVPQLEEDTLAPWGDLDAEEVSLPAAPKPKRIAFVGAGDSVRVKLLAGVDAPTDGTPYPVVFKLIDNVSGPDDSTLGLGEARLIAAAQGSLVDSRALFRLTQINIRYPDGSRKVMPIDGWIVGEDGIRGMEGILIDPIGKALAGSFMSGFVEGLGEGAEAASTTQVITNDGSSYSYVSGDLIEYAVANGLGEAGDRWSQFIDDRARLLVPHVRVFSGREATAVFSQNLELEDLFEQLEDDGLRYVSLD